MAAEEETKTSPAKRKVQGVGKPFFALGAAAQLVCVVLYLATTTSTDMWWTRSSLNKAGATGVVPSAANMQLYNNYIGVTLMLFIGFGYLMTFLRYYGLGALGLTMFIICIGMQWSIWVFHMFGNLANGEYHSFPFDVKALLEGDFAVAAFLISFGGIIGKANPAQLLVLTLLEAVFYSANTQLILFKWLEVADCGGTIVIHMFGAYFGLAVAWVLGKPTRGEEKETSSRVSDLFSFIGTLFLWLYWPTFVAGWLPPGTVQADTAITNTVLALLASTVCTFLLSAGLNDKIFRPVDIQNATLAGGVTIGALANLNIGPGIALLVGCAAGLLSTFGFCKVQGFLCEKLGLHDSCGINNLHGMPSILGAILSIIAPAFGEQKSGTGAFGKPGNQLLALVLTLLVSILTGLLTGFVMKLLKDEGEAFNDKEFWEVAEDEEAVSSDPKATTAATVQVEAGDSGKGEAAWEGVVTTSGAWSEKR